MVKGSLCALTGRARLCCVGMGVHCPPDAAGGPLRGNADTALETTSVVQASLAAGLYELSAGRRSSSCPAVSMSLHPVYARHSHTLLVWS